MGIATACAWRWSAPGGAARLIRRPDQIRPGTCTQRSPQAALAMSPTGLTSLTRKLDSAAVGHLRTAGSAVHDAFPRRSENSEPSGVLPPTTRAPGARAGRPSRGPRPRPGRPRAARPQRRVPRGRRAIGANPRPKPPAHATPYPSSPCHPPVRSNRFLSATFEEPPRLPPSPRAWP